MSPSTPDHRPEKPSGPDFNSIPIIDLSALGSPDLDVRQNLAAQIYQACTEVGFFYIKNHGISEALIEELHAAARSFFALPDEQKMEYDLAKSKKYRGFMPLYAEQTTGSEIDDTSEKKAPGALSEAFDIGYEIAGDPQHTAEDILPPDTYNLYGDNQWPGDDVLPGFRKTYIQYFSEMSTLCRKLMRSFALALDIEESFFDSKVDYPGATSRMLHYPPQPVDGEVIEGLGAHTDYECFTILSQDNIPALQVQNAQGEWIVAPPIPGTLVVNIADCLSVWTNRKFKSTIHRVNNLTGQERYSIPFFFGVDYDTTVSVLPNCISDDRPPCSEPFNTGEVRQGSFFAECKDKGKKLMFNEQFVRAKLGQVYVAYDGKDD